MIERLLSQNATIADALRKTATTSQQMGQAVSGAIMDMQFQDRVMQHIQNVNGALGVMSRTGGLLAARSRAEFEVLPLASSETALLQEVSPTSSRSVNFASGLLQPCSLRGYSVLKDAANTKPAANDVDLIRWRRNATGDIQIE